MRVDLLSICGALAAGEYLASLVPNFADAWPLAAAMAVFVLCFGYGTSVRGWHLLFIFLFGMTLFLLSSTADEQLYREKPWMRGRERREYRVERKPGNGAAAVKAEFSRRIGIGLSDDRETVALSRAILLGERWGLSPRMKRTFVESGTMHVFAISGLHVMAVAGLLTYVLSLLMIPRRFTGLLTVPILWGYVYLIGMSPSAVRAGTMATFQCLSPVFWRRSDGLRSWTLTFLIVHLVQPRMIVSVGNALSFAVMLSIVVVGDWSRNLAKWKQSLLVTTAAWSVGVPIAAHVFGRVTPGGMLANLVLIATAKLTVAAGALGIGLSYVSERLAAHVNNLSALGVRSMVLVADVVSRLPGATLETGCWSLSACGAWYAVLILVAFLIVRVASRRRMI